MMIDQRTGKNPADYCTKSGCEMDRPCPNHAYFHARQSRGHSGGYVASAFDRHGNLITVAKGATRHEAMRELRSMFQGAA